MIDQIEGTVKTTEAQRVVVDLGVICLALQVPDGSVFQAGTKQKVFVHMYWNQDNGPSLFGFHSEVERTVFLLIISCSGIGPKIGLVALAQLGPQQFIEAVQQGKDSVLSGISGIGAKKAEHIIVQLKHKVAKLIKAGIALEVAVGVQDWSNVMEVLESLNYSRMEVSAAMNYLRDKHACAQLPFDQLMRHALSFLAKKA